MGLEYYYNENGTTGVSGLWSIRTERITVDGTPEDLEKTTLTPEGAVGVFGDVRMEARVTESPEKVCVRDDCIRNLSDETLTVYRALSRFVLPDGEYEVYTQKSGWEFESEGGWQPLVAKAAVWNRGIRCCEGASPMLALWNRQTGRGIVFHVFASAAWKLTAGYECDDGCSNLLVVEAGVNDRDMALKLAPGEEMTLPKIVYYTFREKGDMECARLHGWYNRNYPRKKQPVIFNTWMMTFDRIDLESTGRQAELAAGLGAEYFVVDAGWFGNDGRWYENIGAWEENRSGAFCGQMDIFADKVRSLGMKFGLWLEPERALGNVAVVKEHPDWFFYNGHEYLTDFGNDEAREYFTDVARGLVRKYGIEYIKFDFNAALSCDPTGNAFLRYHKGHEKFLQDIRDEFPGIYLENCASGGQRMEMYTSTLFDSDWISDNQSIYEEVRILKETALRLSPCCIEKWPVLKDAEGFINYRISGGLRKLLACDDAEWANVRGVNESWLRAFTCGGPLGLSFDLTVLSPETLELIADIVKEYKAGRDFWQRANVSILSDTPTVTAMEYKTPEEIRITVFAWFHRQSTLELFPHVERESRYEWEGKTLFGAEIEEKGLRVPFPGAQNASVIILRRK